MPRPIAYGRNILEAMTLTVTGEEAASPRARLVDRDITLRYVDTGVTSPRVITGDTGAGVTPTAWDTWILAPGHNLAGVTLTIESSTDMAAWTPRDTVVATDGLMRRTLAAPVSARGVRLVITSPPSPPRLTELIVSLAVPWPLGPSIEGLTAGSVASIVRHESLGAHVWKSLRAGPRWDAEYELTDLTSAGRDVMAALWAEIASGVKPFYLADHDGTLRWVEWVAPEARFTASGYQDHTLSVHLTEVL